MSGVDFSKAPPRFTYSAERDETLSAVGGVAVEPPIDLIPGQCVELWWFMSKGLLRYHHEGSRDLEKSP